MAEQDAQLSLALAGKTVKKSLLPGTKGRIQNA